MVHAIVLLQPVPKHIRALKLLARIKKEKEVEGFHPFNAVDTLVNGVSNTLYPMCLPGSLFELFSYYGIQVSEGAKIFVFASDEDFLSNPFRSLILRVAASQVVPANCSVDIFEYG